MIRKNILAIALLGVFGLSHAADVENLRTISYLNEPLRLQADVIGEGDVILAERTEYLRLNHPIPSYDLAVNVVEEDGKKQLVLTTTEEVETPALTLLLESRDENNRRQLFELPILLDIRPEPSTEVAEIEIDGVSIDADQVAESTDKVTLSDVPVVAPVAPKVANAKDADTQPKVAEPKKEVKKAQASPEKEAAAEKQKAKAEKAAKPVAKAQKPASSLKNTVDPALVKRYGPVEAGETMWSIANKVRPAHIPPKKMIEIIKKHNPSAFTPAGVLRANVTLIIPVDTPKKQHNFVKAEATTEAVGFIYELPEPPLTGAAQSSSAVAAPVDAGVAAEVVENDGAVTEAAVMDEVPVKVIHPVGSTTNDDMTVISPAEPSIGEVTSVAPSVPVVEAQTVTDEQGDAMSASVAAETFDVQAPAQGEAVQASIAEVTESVANVAPAKPKVFMVEEPEEEPGIIELIFDNIMYVGGGVLILLLAILAIVAMRRRQAGEGSSDQAPKAPKEKKAKKGKKSEAPAEEAVIVEEMIEEAPKKGAPQVKSASAKAAAAAAIAAPVAAVLSSEGASPAKDGTEIQSLDFDFSFTEEKPQAAAAPKAEAKPQEAEFDTLDFDFSFDAPSEAKPATVETAAVAEPEMGGLEFDLSGFEAPKADAVAESVEEMSTFDTLEFDGVLDFTGRNTEETPAESEPVVAAVEAEVATVEPAMDFEPIAFDPIAVEEVTPSDEPEAVSFGENNPLFASQDSDSGAIEAIASEENNDPTAEITEYVSFGDLIDTAQTSLENDEQVADIAEIDLANFEEDDAIEFADLMEVSTQESDHNLDLSFVADVDDNDAGHDFLDSLDFSAPAEIDPIGDSVKDNIAKAEESLERLHAAENPVVDVAVPEVVEATEEMDFPSFDLSEFEAPIAETIETVDAFEGMEPLDEIELIDIPSFTEPAPEPVVITEPVVTAPAAPMVETVVEATPVVAPVAPSVIEKEVIVEKPVVQVVEVPVPMAEASEDDESEQIKLELAEAYIDFDPSLAKPLLEEVVRDGNPSQVARAEALLSKIN